MFSKKITKQIAFLLIFTLTMAVATPAPAWSRTVHHYHHHSSDNSAAWGIGGLAAGLILGSIISDNNNKAPKEPQVTDIEERLSAFSSQAIVEAQKMIAQYGIDEGLARINDYWAQRSYDTIYDPIELRLSVADAKNQFKLTYIIDRQALTVETRVVHRSSGKNSFRKAYLNPPEAQKNPSPEQIQRSCLDLIGFSLADKRVNGNLTVAQVMEGTAAYYAGLRGGTQIIAIDGNKTTQMMPDQMQAYIAKRAANGNTVKVQFVAPGGVIKSAIIRPQL